ncbi:hypothetical protein N0V93_003553 [Gnomoniopsis smithogilvyi]|uniref:DOMON domain-containing protein n=1 Tax=Gnomoniopsis smithogilvyi TaxID=1191159 RepID=A0A9W8YYX5_9PEZI|nr:hypothetical protein N0V93_003553 [Gnomoniopsis smithogilvyi]
MQTPLALTTAIAALLSATSVSADALSTCASSATDVCYAIGVPTTTASETTGNMYIQISAPTTYTWVALGMGTQEMAGANMFILYTDGTGNVTVSSRQGTGETTPKYSASTASDIQLMSGSGVTNGKMVANILCTNCKSWSGGSLSTTSTSVAMIGAWKSGASLDSTDPSASISYHDAHTAFDLDLTQATLTTDSNPFTSAATTTTTGSSGVTQAARPDPKVIYAHGLGMALVFVVLYPLGSALMPMLGKWKLHAGFQIVAWLGMWAFFGLGVYGAQVRNLLFNNSHTLFGTVVVCLLAIQPALGQLHHSHFMKTGGRGIVSYVHLWWGRILLVLGTINGGLGFQLTHTSHGWITAYSIIAVVFYLFYAVVKVFTAMRHQRRSGNMGKMMSPRTGYSVERADDEVPMNSYNSQRIVYPGK